MLQTTTNISSIIVRAQNKTSMEEKSSGPGHLK